MPRFVHIDHSLCRVGGHEYDYAMNILRSVEASGFEVVLGVNRRFCDRSALPGRWPVYPLFRHTAHTKNCVSLGGQDQLPINTAGRRLPLANHGSDARPAARFWGQSVAALRRLRRYLSRRRRIRHFAEACHQLFRHVELAEADHVFLATFTEFDLLGLTSFLSTCPASRVGVWHLQFHFDLFAGCGDAGSCRDERIDLVRQQFRYALDQLPHHRIHFYTTTAELAAQYNQLGVAEFRHLPYPVNPALQRQARPSGDVLRITCAGGMRREKGIRALGTIVNSLRDDPFFAGKVEIAAQVPPARLRRLGIGDARVGRPVGDLRVMGLPYPLSIDAYHDLIRQTDIGLFLYDNRRYHVRCSGILQEMLAAGKPVIVPAGCWLAEQIAESVTRHVEGLRQGLPQVGGWHASEISWKRGGRGAMEPILAAGELSFAGPEYVRAEVPVPDSASELLLAFRRVEPIEAGTYVRIRTAQFDRAGNRVQRFDSILGPRPGNRRATTLIHLDPQAVRTTVDLKNAYHDQRTAVTDLSAEFLDAQATGGCAAGSVGLIAADAGQVPMLLREMAARYDHYRETAEAFSRSWLYDHHPARTVDILSSTGSLAANAAA